MKKIKGLKEVTEFIENKNNFKVLNDYDADGLCAGAIIRKTLERLGKKYEAHTLRHFSKNKINEHKGNKPIILIDFGSGYLKMLKEEAKNNEYCIIDHHEIEGETEKPHLNPHLSGHDGSTEISSSGLSYLVAREIDKNNKDLAKIGVVGALGDMQYSDKNRLIGLNQEVVKDGKKSGELEVREDITLFGRHSRPLIPFLAYSTNPYLPGLTNNRGGCREFLRNIGISLKNGGGGQKYYCDLSKEEKRKIISGLHIHGRQKGVPEHALQNLVGEVYELKHEPNKSPVKDGKEFSTLLNACGRHDEPEIGINVAMGDREKYYNKAEKLLKKHRRQLRKGIEYAKNNGLEEKENFYFINAGEKIPHTLIGIVMGMLYSTKEVSRKKPILGAANKEENKIKFSGRGNQTLINKGLNLGEAFYQAAEETEGEGGGHDVAAGATIPKDKIDKFIEISNEKIRKQLN